MDGKPSDRMCGMCIVVMFMFLTGVGYPDSTKPGTPEKALVTPTNVFEARAVENMLEGSAMEGIVVGRYVLFAKKADEEGYTQVACLFRALATAEKVHGENLIKAAKGFAVDHYKIFMGDDKPVYYLINTKTNALRQMGDMPKVVKAGEEKSTKVNLENAVDAETKEGNVYSGFLKTVGYAKLAIALETFTKAKSAEAVHAKLLQEALDNPDAWKAGKKDFFVCSDCGNVVAVVEFDKCPVCGAIKGNFTKATDRTADLLKDVKR